MKKNELNKAVKEYEMLEKALQESLRGWYIETLLHAVTLKNKKIVLKCLVINDESKYKDIELELITACEFLLREYKYDEECMTYVISLVEEMSLGVNYFLLKEAKTLMLESENAYKELIKTLKN